MTRRRSCTIGLAAVVLAVSLPVQETMATVPYGVYSGCTTQECAVKLGKVLDQHVLSLRVIDVETAKAVQGKQ